MHIVAACWPRLAQVQPKYIQGVETGNIINFPAQFKSVPVSVQKDDGQLSPASRRCERKYVSNSS
jgi:hypothetical protein